MPKYTHGFSINCKKCNGGLACMRACPTHAIRIKEGKATLLPELCIDCGSCLRACPSGSISAATRSVKDMSNFRYKVVVPTPVLFGQFPINIPPAHIIKGLRSLGFDAVWFEGVEFVRVGWTIRDCIGKWAGRIPLISSSCPVIVRLIQVAYPDMLEQLLHVQPPRELAGRQLKRKYSEEMGLPENEIAAIYVSPCQAKTVSIIQPAEGGKSYLDGSIGISDIYNDILAFSHHLPKNDFRPEEALQLYGDIFQWAIGEGLRMNLSGYRYMSVTGLGNVIRVFEDIEKGKLQNVDFLECSACWGGCVNGNLTVDNMYMSRNKLQKIMAEFPKRNIVIESEAIKRYSKKDIYIDTPIRARSIRGDMGDLKERIKRIQESEAVLRTLPGLDCGLCGAPNCKTLAQDIASGDAQKTDCIFLFKDQLEKLRATYL